MGFKFSPQRATNIDHPPPIGEHADGEQRRADELGAERRREQASKLLISPRKHKAQPLRWVSKANW